MSCCSGAEGMGRFWDLKGCCLLPPSASQPRGASGEENQSELLEDFRAHFQPAVSGTLTGLPILEWEAGGGWMCHWAGLHGAEVGVGMTRKIKPWALPVVLIPGTTCCAGAQPGDEVMKDRDGDSRAT